MGVYNKRKRCLFTATVLTIVGITQSLFSFFSLPNPNDYVHISRKLSVEKVIESYSTKGSIAGVINTAKMGTDGLHKTFNLSWQRCKKLPEVDSVVPADCRGDLHTFQTHFFDKGSEYIQEHRRNNPEGQCIIATSLRSPETWFGSMYLQIASVRHRWKPNGEMIGEYRNFLAKSNFDRIHDVLPGLLKEFNAGTLTEQVKIMDDNGGYSLMTAPPTSALAGCDLLFLRMENSSRWPDIFRKLDPVFRNSRSKSRAEKNSDNISQVNAIASYKLTSEEKRNIYNKGDKFFKEWFDVYGYMDDVNAKESR